MAFARSNGKRAADRARPMNLKHLTAVDSSPEAVTLTFTDDQGEQHKLSIRPESLRPIIDGLLRLLAHAAPKPGLAFDIASCRMMRSARGVVLTDRSGLEITLLLEEVEAVALASCVTEVAQTYDSGEVH